MIFRTDVASLFFFLFSFSEVAAQSVSCADRNTTENLCLFSETTLCCSSSFPLSGGSVLLPNDGNYVPCHGAKEIFENASSSEYSDSMCNTLLERIESSIESPCYCKDKNRPSCADRNTTKKLCDFKDVCCNKFLPSFSNILLLPDDESEVQCHVAKEIFERNSPTVTDAECDILAERIESSLAGSSFCSCKNEIDAGPCAERQNGNLALCNFLPEGRECCPKTHSLRLPLPGSNEGASCGDAKSSFSNSLSSRWTDEECESIKLTIESVIFEINGCVCPGDPRLDTDPPSRSPTFYPTISSFPSVLPSSSLRPSASTIPTESIQPSSSSGPSEQPSMTASETPSKTPSLIPSTSTSPSGLPSTFADSLTTCFDRPQVESLCPYDSQCCVVGNGGLVRTPNATEVMCHEALALFKSPESKEFTDNDCYLLLLGIESELGDDCACNGPSAQPTVTASQNPSKEPSLTPSASISPTGISERKACSDRPQIDAICKFSNTCCVVGNSGLVRTPNATEVFCYEALALFESPESKQFTDNECYLLLFGIEDQLGVDCTCSPVFCFSGRSTVNVRGKGNIEMSRLRIGDKVLTGKDIYEPVYSFGHRGEGVQTNFLRISTAKSSLEISPEHMVLTNSFIFTPASSLQKGDVLYNEIGHETVIRSIESITSKGVYAPFTPSGRLVVNGIVVSSFIALENNSFIKVMGVPISHQWIALMFEFPHRVVCQYYGTCLNESYTKDGVSTWVARPLHLGQWLLNLPNGLFRLTLMVMLLSILCVFSVLEFLLRMPVVSSFILLFSFVHLLRISLNLKEKRKL